MTVTIWHNPRCTKSRETLALLEQKGVDLDVRLYLENPPTEQELVALQKLLDRPVIKFTRPKEKLFSELGLTKSTSDADLIRALAQNPRLIERPVVFANGKARLGRPPEAVLEIL